MAWFMPIDSLPPPPPVISPTYNSSAKYNVLMTSGNSKDTNGFAMEGTTRTSSTSVPAGFRSVSRPMSKKPEKGQATSTVTTSYSLPTGFQPLPDNVRVTPKNELAEGAVYETRTLEGNVLHTDTYYPAPGEKEILERTKKTVIIKAEQHLGMGPTDEHGVPVALRSTVDNPKQWYKNMFKQIHKLDHEDNDQDSRLSTSHDVQEDRPVISQVPSYKPKKLGHITDYTPSKPYVVENKPHENRSPLTSTSSKPSYVEQPKRRQVSSTEEPIHGTEYHEKDYEMADHVVMEPKHVVHIHPTKPKETKPQGKRQHARVKFDFTPQSNKQLRLKKDQVVVIERKINNDWFEGETPDGKHSGMFPVAYVEVLQPSQHKEPKKGLAKAKFDFNATNPKQLSMKKGDSVELLEKVDKNWYKGAIGKRSGLLPANYIEVFREPEEKSTAATSRQHISTVAQTAAEKAPNSNQYFHNASTSSSSSNGEPDDKAKMSKASFLANAVVNSGTTLLHKPQVKRGEFDIPEFDDAVTGFASNPKSRQEQETQNSHETTPSTISIDLANDLFISKPISSTTSSDDKRDLEDDDFNVAREKHVCLYNYVPQNEDELELEHGDIVQVVEKCDDGWYVGTCVRTGSFGTFPGNYVAPAD